MYWASYPALNIDTTKKVNIINSIFDNQNTGSRAVYIGHNGETQDSEVNIINSSFTRINGSPLHVSHDGDADHDLNINLTITNTTITNNKDGIMLNTYAHGKVYASINNSILAKPTNGTNLDIRADNADNSVTPVTVSHSLIESYTTSGSGANLIDVKNNGGNSDLALNLTQVVRNQAVVPLYTFYCHFLA